MRLQWYVCHFLVAFTSLQAGKASRVKLVNNGYENVVVAISPDVDEVEGNNIIDGIKEIIRETSEHLHKATRKRDFFRKVKILIPISWGSVTVTSTITDETFEDSDIRIYSANFVYKNQPYTEHSGKCGQQGRFIHLTPDYAFDREIQISYGPSGKVLLQEWAKYRWGVFDEQGYDWDRKMPSFYWDQDSRRIKTTSCTDKELVGSVSCSDGSDGGQNITKMNEMCTFTEDENQGSNSSIMAQHFYSKNSTKDSIVEFCDEEDSDHPHNSAAPTKQNRNCDRRSVWTILRKHIDFFGDVNPPNDNYVEPQFEVIQESYPSYALVMDTSDSMLDFQRHLKLERVAAQWLLHQVPDNSQVAMIKFSSSASLLHPLINVTDEDSRNQLLKTLDVSPDGSTSIGAGLRLAVKTLTGQPKPIILLITDGAENTSPYMDDVMKEVKDSVIRVVTVAFSEAADNKLEAVAEETNGKAFFVNDHNSEQQLDGAFGGTITYQPKPPKSEIVVVIHEPTTYQGNETMRNGSFNIDKSIGRNMEFRLYAKEEDYITEPPKLVRPDGAEITKFTYDNKTISWVIKVDEAEEGLWQWRVGLSGEADNTVRVKVTAQTRNAEISPITTKAWLEKGTYGSMQVDILEVYAEVRQGSNPVLNATVRALVTLPSITEPEELELFDDGRTVDDVENDGTYSYILRKYNGDGRYSVVVQVEGDDNTGVLGEFLTQKRKKRSTSSRNREKPKYCCGSMIPVGEEEVFATGKFSRIATAGALNLVDVPNVDDFLPPAKVDDLVVSFVDYHVENATYVNVKLTWTAAGDDLHDGIVSSYDIRMNLNGSDLTDETFDLDASNTTTVVLDVDVPLVKGRTPISVDVVVKVNEDTRELFFALQAVDDEGLKSQVSNVALLQIPAPEALPQGFPVWVIALITVLIGCLVVAGAVAGCVFRRHNQRWSLIWAGNINNSVPMSPSLDDDVLVTATRATTKM